MRCHQDDRSAARVLQQSRSLHKRARAVDQVVDHNDDLAVNRAHNAIALRTCSNSYM